MNQMYGHEISHQDYQGFYSWYSKNDVITEQLDFIQAFFNLTEREGYLWSWI